MIACGKDMRLEVRSGGEYFFVEGERTLTNTLSRAVVSGNNKASGGWRETVEGCGINQQTISFEGLVTDGEIQSLLHQRIFQRVFVDFRVTDGIDTYIGSGLLSSLERVGTYNGAEAITFTIETSGNPKLTENFLIDLTENFLIDNLSQKLTDSQ